MIDASTEKLIPFQSASTHIPNRPHISTLHRWRLKGVRGVRLESILCGNNRFTSTEAIQRFIARLNEAEFSAPEITESQRLRDSVVAREELRKMGI
jgi:hypothetical protein